MEKDLVTLGELHFGAPLAFDWFADRSLLHLTVHGVQLHGVGDVDEARVHVVNVIAGHVGHHHGDVLDNGMTILPGDNHPRSPPRPFPPYHSPSIWWCSAAW